MLFGYDYKITNKTWGISANFDFVNNVWKIELKKGEF